MKIGTIVAPAFIAAGARLLNNLFCTGEVVQKVLHVEGAARFTAERRDNANCLIEQVTLNIVQGCGSRQVRHIAATESTGVQRPTLQPWPDPISLRLPASLNGLACLVYCPLLPWR